MKITRKDIGEILVLEAVLLIACITFPSNVTYSAFGGSILALSAYTVYVLAKEKWVQVKPKLLDAMPILMPDKKKG